uniref:Uncharacterized protein n=1 Tax=Ditylenchus dipsaci TaxID=166011 RepID=A0A915EJ85_9BILA
MNTSRIYIIGIEEGTLLLKLQKYINSEELGRWDLSCPLSVCNGPGRGTAMLICTMADGKMVQEETFYDWIDA